MRLIVFLATLVLSAPPILETLGVELSYGISLNQATNWLFEGSLRVILIAVLAYFTIRVAALGIAHFETVVSERAKDTPHRQEFAERIHTIGGLVGNAVNVLVISAAALMVLQEFGVNIAPLLTAAAIIAVMPDASAQERRWQRPGFTIACCLAGSRPRRRGPATGRSGRSATSSARVWRTLRLCSRLRRSAKR